LICYLKNLETMCIERGMFEEQASEVVELARLELKSLTSDYDMDFDSTPHTHL